MASAWTGSGEPARPDAAPYFVGTTLDDVMRECVEALYSRGGPVEASKGSNVELTGVLLEIADPRARLSRTETRGKPFSCLGELLWYLAGSRELSFIEYYLADYRRLAEGDIIYGGYGPRLIRQGGLSQIDSVISLLKRRRTSRQAVIQLFDAEDILVDHKDVPCTCSLQFLIRDNELRLIAHMRSNDVFKGLAHDVFCFTMLQELVARSVGVEIGVYRQFVGSLHAYDEDRSQLEAFLAEGWQETKAGMPAMPAGDPWLAVRDVLNAESALRERRPLEKPAATLDPYWQDLIQLLKAFRAFRDKDLAAMQEFGADLSSAVYRPYVGRKLEQLRQQVSPAT